jgi:hypothetical protein
MLRVDLSVLYVPFSHEVTYDTIVAEARGGAEPDRGGQGHGGGRAEETVSGSVAEPVDFLRLLLQPFPP